MKKFIEGKVFDSCGKESNTLLNLERICYVIEHNDKNVCELFFSEKINGFTFFTDKSLNEVKEIIDQ
jgi:hypothetical protein